jgi:hypothetical protein
MFSTRIGNAKRKKRTQRIASPLSFYFLFLCALCVQVLSHIVNSEPMNGDEPGAVAPSIGYSGRMWGNRITSRMLGLSVSSITNRSTPIPVPAVGGSPYSKARM